MADSFALTNCGQIATFSGTEIVKDGVVHVARGRIVAVSEGQQIPPHVETIDVGGRVVTPGLIDAHTHAVFAGSRSDEMEMRASGATYQEIAEQGGGIMSTVRAVRELDGDALFEIAKGRVEQMLRCGTTTAEIKSGYGLATLQEVKILEVARRLGDETPLDVVTTFLGAHAVPPEFVGNRRGYMDLVVGEMLPLMVELGLASYVDIFVEEGYFDAEDARRLCGRLPMRMHVDQFSTGGAELAAELGAVTADHLEQTGAKGIEALVRGGVTPVLLPASVYCLGLTKYPDARAMIDAGLPVVLATDFNPGSAPTPSLPFVMSLACTQMGMTAIEALRGCTVNAARSLGFSDRGVLTTGAVADIVVWDTDSIRDIPYFVGAPLVWAVYKDGERVV
ncbi:MAG TPA: imidazolonepropionase [Fimbriimonadaceae bacterium]|nr:imidazolonepropionase [Fimbriimonadaceae bacterium]